MKKQTGFTLVELMISIVLGLIIVAAALLLFLSGQRNVAMQKNTTDLQDDQNFGLNYIAKNIRKANLNSPSASLSNTSNFSGIVFSSANVSNKLVLNTNFNSKFVTANISTNTSNMRIKNATTTPASFDDAVNDQLVIQYRPTEIGGYDCEGKVIDSTNIYILERYFVRTDTNGSGTDAEKSALACASSRYSSGLTVATALESSNTAGLYGSGEIIMKRVDLFRVRFLVQDTSGKKYMTVLDYNALTTTKPRILAVQLGVIARAQDTSVERAVSTSQEFSMFGQTITQKTTFPNRYVRTPIMQTVALRNALGSRS
ncbi:MULTISPECIES: PilW family protein [Acinetobacter]|uniref:PilW family protein n=1 Tax=Acinetobacter TaxID=469 RepID=UPI000E34A095|nr:MULTISPECIES: PilW family protein [Acinetobacter]RFS33248.1 prepilin-type N-terminal cleavage/methylation domain-containing protein [Acinetobacter sp. SWAC5]RKG46148.1 prepilin-type N-terminal cleavage/methylation domain-containing protein [Acinetobacter cumulans]RZG61243.1 prepilin-type N-terminal cleavage/methylation domain-containing protein [Acinetobacter sp. WCHAc060006]